MSRGKVGQSTSSFLSSSPMHLLIIDKFKVVAHSQKLNKLRSALNTKLRAKDGPFRGRMMSLRRYTLTFSDSIDLALR